jgi:hypothetical protein
MSSSVWAEIVAEIEAKDRERGWRYGGDPYVHALLLDAKEEGTLEQALEKFPSYRPVKRD